MQRLQYDYPRRIPNSSLRRKWSLRKSLQGSLASDLQCSKAKIRKINYDNKNQDKEDQPSQHLISFNSIRGIIIWGLRGQLKVLCKERDELFAIENAWLRVVIHNYNSWLPRKSLHLQFVDRENLRYIQEFHTTGMKTNCFLFLHDNSRHWKCNLFEHSGCEHDSLTMRFLEI